MSTVRHLSWENFRTTVLVRGQQRVHRVTDTPRIEVFYDGVANRIGMLLETAPGTLIPPGLSKLVMITIRTLNKDGRFFLEIATNTASLQRQFYHFAMAVTERVADNCAALEAVAVELQCFTDLLEERSLLGIEHQIGLLGELIFLERLVAKKGIDALNSWIGPGAEPHDFRVKDVEFEVKTTLATQRVHTINGMEQLAPSDGCALFLVSVLLGPPGAGDGFSLPNKIKQLSDRFASKPTLLAQFNNALKANGFETADSKFYSREYKMRRPVGIVRVDSSFPSITRHTIQDALGALAPRIESLQYDVSVEGLEHEDGTAEFEAVITD